MKVSEYCTTVPFSVNIFVVIKIFTTCPHQNGAMKALVGLGWFQFKQSEFWKQVYIYVVFPCHSKELHKIFSARKFPVYDKLIHQDNKTYLFVYDWRNLYFVLERYNLLLI